VIKEGSYEAKIGSIAEEELRELVTGSLKGGPINCGVVLTIVFS